MPTKDAEMLTSFRDEVMGAEETGLGMWIREKAVEVKLLD